VKFPFDLNAKPDDEEEASAKVGGGSETKLSVSETADNIGPDNDLEVTPDNDVHPTHAADSGYDEDRASIVEGGSGTGNRFYSSEIVVHNLDYIYIYIFVYLFVTLNHIFQFFF